MPYIYFFKISSVLKIKIIVSTGKLNGLPASELYLAVKFKKLNRVKGTDDIMIGSIYFELYSTQLLFRLVACTNIDSLCLEI